MKKITLLIAIIGAINLGGFSQASSYAFTAVAGTFNELTAGTNVSGVEADSYLSGKLPIGFTFTFDGVAFDSLKASSNGFVSFGNGTSNQTGNNLDLVAAASRPLIAPLWDDHDGRATGGVSYASYATTGIAPNRVFTFEWKNWEWRYNSSTPVISFQVKLYETSNLVEFHYRQESGAVSSGSASIGITGVSSFLSLDGTGTAPLASSTSETANLNTKPATGQVYRFTPPSCPAPSALTATNIATTSASLGWTEAGSATQWELEWDTAGFTLGSGNNITTANTTNPYSISTFTANTNYEFYVRAACGANDSSNWSGPFSFNTLCNTFNVPFQEGFNSTSSTFGCWTVINNNTDNDTWAINTSSSYTYEGDQSVTMYTDYNSGANDDYLISPSITLTGNDRLRFWYRARSAFEPNDYKVLISTTGINPADFTDTLLVDTATITTYAEHIIDLSSYSGNVHIAFYIPTGGLDGYYLYIDNMTVEAIPTCIEPSSLMTSNETTVGADLFWSEMGTASTWDVEIVPTRGTPTGTATNAGLTSDSVTISGLNSSTIYDYYVRAYCSAGDQSAWVGPFTFTTTCAAVSSFSEDFEGVTVPNVPLCWSDLYFASSTSAYIKSYNSTSNAYSGSKSIRFYNSSDVNPVWMLVSPELSNLSAGTHQTVFFAKDSDANDIIIGTMSDPNDTATFTPFDTVTTTNSYQEYIVSFAGYSGTDDYIAYRSVPGATYDNTYMDDISWEMMPTCPKPTDLLAGVVSNNTASFSWTENGSATAWEIEFDIAGFSQGNGTVVAAITNPYFGGSLTANTAYEFYVRSVCGSGDSSLWVGPLLLVTTPDSITSFPFTNDLESGLGVYLGLRDSANSAASLDAIAGNASTFGVLLTGKSSTGWTGGSTSTTETQAFVSNSTHISAIDMVVDASSVSNLMLSFDLKQTYSYGSKYSWARVTVNGVQVGTSINPTTDNTDPFSNISVDLTTYVGTSFILSIEHSGKYNMAGGSGGRGDDAYVDNIKLFVPILASAVVDSNTTCVGVTDGAATASVTGGTPAYLFSWSNGASTAAISGLAAGMYTVTVTDANSATSTASVTILDGTYIPTVTLGNDTSICAGSSLTLDAGSFSSYSWDDASALQTRGVSYVLGAVNYSVTVSDAAGCVGSDVITVTGFVMPTVYLGNDTTVCNGVNFTLDAGSFSSYVWDDTSTTQTRMTVSTIGAVDYSVVVMDANGCLATDTVEVTGATPVMVNLGNDTTICNTETLTLDAGSFDAYLWDDASMLQNRDVLGAMVGANTYYVAVLNAAGCAGVDSIVVTGSAIVEVNLGADTNIWMPAIDTYTLDAGTGFTSYLWSDNVTATQTYEVRRATEGLVSVIVTDSNGCEGTDTVLVTFSPLSVDEFAVTSLKMYPNPAVDQITVELSNMQNVSDVKVSFLTISGQVVMTQSIAVNGNSYVETFDVSNLATGSYLVHFEANGETVVRQFVIK